MTALDSVLAERLFKDLCGAGNHTLLFGDPKRTVSVMRDVYTKAAARDDWLCSWHDSAKVRTPLDFFEPILRLKYGERCEEFIGGAGGPTPEPERAVARSACLRRRDSAPS